MIRPATLFCLAAAAAFFMPNGAYAHVPVYNYSNAPGPVQWFGHVHGDVVYGSRYGDEFHGQGGADRIYGQYGDDELHGGDGHDEIHGGAGFDICYGGGGIDIFSSCERVRA